jgi:hypothetical protein
MNLEWENLHESNAYEGTISTIDTQRCPVYGGWLVRCTSESASADGAPDSVSLVFVPDHHHVWK